MYTEYGKLEVNGKSTAANRYDPVAVLQDKGQPMTPTERLGG